MEHVDPDKWTPVEQIVGGDAEEASLLQGMLRDATNYLRSFRC